MPEKELPTWLVWARELQALGQTGLTFTTNQYDIQRYQRLIEVAAQIVATHTDLPREFWSKHFLAHPGYATPKIDVRGAVIRDGRVLLVQERSDERWCMPGGWADVGEFPSEMVAREVREESGFEVVPRKLIGVFDANRNGRPLDFFHAYKLVFLCELIGGEARPSDETLAAEFFSFDNLPTLSSARTNEKHLAEVQAHLADSERATAFD